MKIYLVYPYLNNPYFFPPLGIVYLASYLKKQGIETELIDLVFSSSYDDFTDRIKQDPPDIVGISTLTLTISNALELARITKKLYPNCLVVLGGPHATVMSEQSLANPEVDLVVIGEGEETFTELVRAIEQKKDLAEVKGIGFKKDGRPVFTGKRPFMEDLDKLPIPDRSLLPTFRKYLKTQTSFPFFMPSGIMIVSRGCPFKCTFCQPMLSCLYGDKVRLKSPANIIKEIEYLIETYQVKSIYFTDDTFWANPKWATELCGLITERGLDKKVYFLAQTNLTTLDESRMQVMRNAGFIYLGFGVESGNPHILNKVLGKNHSPEKARQVFALCRKYGIVSSANFIIGNPGETPETLQDSIDLMADLNPDMKDVHYMTPTPGSALYDYCKKEGILKYSKWTDPNRYTPDLLELPGLKEGDLEKAYADLNKTYLKGKSLFSAHPLWRKYILNVALVTRNPRAVMRVFVIQYMMMNSLFWHKFWSKVLALRNSLTGKRPPALD